MSQGAEPRSARFVRGAGQPYAPLGTPSVSRAQVRARRAAQQGMGIRLGEIVRRVITGGRLCVVAAGLASVCMMSVAAGADARVPARGTVRGVVMGDGARQAGYRVFVYASRVQGKRHVKLLGTDVTNRAGRFRISYRLRAADRRRGSSVLYVLAQKRRSMLASAIRRSSRGRRVVVNERTTVATATSFAQFVHGRRITGNRHGMLNAVRMAANMARVRTGALARVLNRTPNGGLTSTRATFNSLANMVASCVASRSHCRTLFRYATPRGGRAPHTVLQALANITKDPSHNAGPLFRLARTNATYGPALTAAPKSWLLFLKFTGGFYSRYADSNLMSGPGNIVFDRRGFAWVNDNYVPTGRTAIACAGLRLLKFYPWGRSYPGSPYFGGGISGAGFGIALDPLGRIWDSNFGFEAPKCADGTVPADPGKKIPATHNSVSLFRPNGEPVSPAAGYTNGSIWWPQGTASDKHGDIWIANCGNDTVTMIPNGNPSQAQNIPLPGGQGAMGNLQPMYPNTVPLLKPFGLAIDPQGRAWVTGNKANTVYVINRDGNVQSVPTGGLLTWPMGIAGDSNGNMWVSSSGRVDTPCVTPLDTSQNGSPSVVLFPADGSAPQQFTGGGLTIPWGDAIDGSGNVWVFNFGQPGLGNQDTAVSHFCGADASKCPGRLHTGGAISPPAGYTSDALDRLTGGGIDPSGNLWLMNNWKKTGPSTPVYNASPGGNSIVIVPGAATPVKTPVIGPPEPFGAP
jgi:hypothetical protein